MQFFEDRISGGGPLEGLAVRVVGHDEEVNALHELFDTGERAAADGLVGLVDDAVVRQLDAACHARRQIGHEVEGAYTCIERYFLDEYGGKLVLSCNQPIRGSLLMPDGYIPGTLYEYPEQELPAPALKIFDTRFGTIQISDADFVFAGLPAESGPGDIGWLWQNGHLALPGHSAFELTVPSSYVIVTSDAYFTRVPEPGTLFLASLALGIVALRRTDRTPVA